MIKAFSVSLAAVLFLVAGTVPGKPRAGLPLPQEIPRTAIVEIILLQAPGLNDEGSRLEMAYEFRIANDAVRYQGWKQKQTKGGSDERVGELIKDGVVKKTLRSLADRKIVLQIPLSAEIQERLRNHPRDRIKLPTRITP